VVQGNVPRLGLDVYRQARVVTDNHLAGTVRLASEVAAGRLPAPQLVVWPENASDFDPFDDATARATIENAVAAIDVPILVGAVLDGPGPLHVRNAGVVWTPQLGPTELYLKRHLVPSRATARGCFTRVPSRWGTRSASRSPTTRWSGKR
jgi:apolipoprotein N-acyltransferase